ncbi:hypothetical protein K469DRAFT_549696, partial [Zopfia rhizophila CBS 207.26]
PLYINAILIQFYKRVVEQLCSTCYSAYLGLYSFLKCCRVKEHFSRAYTNYK